MRLRLLFLLLLTTGAVRAQVPGASLHGSFYGAAATGDVLPLWLHANRHGLYDAFGPNAFARAGATYGRPLGPRLDMDIGLDAVWGRDAIGGASLQQAYVRLSALGFRLDAGRVEPAAPDLDPLSSGTFGLGTNARPIPQVGLSVPDFLGVPLTRGWLAFKGSYVHGWLGGDRFVDDAFLHAKTFYLRAGGPLPVRAFAGLHHYALWGGTHPTAGPMPEGLGEFIRVNLVQSGSSDNPFEGERFWKTGNHLGQWHFGVDLDVRGATVRGYWQHMFEDKSGFVFRNLPDNLIGIVWRRHAPGRLIDAVLWESVYTKHQSGPGRGDPPGLVDPEGDRYDAFGYRYNGRDDYYNHSIYRSGWTYAGRSLGTPLYLTTAMASRLVDYDAGLAFASNRIVAQHTGLEGSLHPRLRYRALATYVRHYGTYETLNFRTPWNPSPSVQPSDYAFTPSLDQWSLLLEATVDLQPAAPLHAMVGAAYDTGDLARTVGLAVGVRWVSR